MPKPEVKRSVRHGIAQQELPDRLAVFVEIVDRAVRRILEPIKLGDRVTEPGTDIQKL